MKYFHQDHLGSATVVTDGITGLKIPGEEAEYLPFGGQRGSSAISVTNYGFTDQEKDPETGLYNYDARLYDPAIGVFVSADTIVPDPGGSQGFNRYAYCYNNPIIYTDPSGNFSFFDPIGSWLAEKSGVDSISVGFFYLIGGEFRATFNDNMIDITNVGIGVGVGFSVSVNSDYGDVSYGVATYVAVGYNFEGGGWYVKGSGTFGGVSVSGAYYFDSGYYSVGLGYGYNGIGVNASYSNYGGVSAGASVIGVGANYNFESGRWRASADASAVAEFAVDYYASCQAAKEKKVVQNDSIQVAQDDDLQVDQDGKLLLADSGKVRKAGKAYFVGKKMVDAYNSTGAYEKAAGDRFSVYLDYLNLKTKDIQQRINSAERGRQQAFREHLKKAGDAAGGALKTIYSPKVK